MVVTIYPSIKNKKYFWRRIYIIDFYCAKLKLWIEIDGESHDWQSEYDEERTNYLKGLWIKIIRYTNNQVYYQLDWVLIDLAGQIEERAQELDLLI